jgi:hypothetical protein
VTLLIWAHSIAVNKPVIAVAIANVMMRLRMSPPQLAQLKVSQTGR